jgi:hypothetical protein
VIGLAARRQSWKQARTVACSYAAVSRRVAVVPEDRLTDPLATLHAERLGIGLVVTNEQRSLVLARPTPYQQPRRTRTLELVDEIIYDAAVRAGGFDRRNARTNAA